MNRSELIEKAKRIVVKVGTSILTTDTGRIDDAKIYGLVEQLAKASSQGYEVILVTSGSIAAGREALGFKSIPKAIPELQAAASVGQGLLVHRYAELFKKKGLNVGQVLVTRADTHHQQYVNVKNTLKKLIDLKAIPIINENDSTAIDEIKFGDNDTLAGLISNIIEADLLIMLSDVDGLFSADPKATKAELMSEVREITSDIEAIAGGSGTAFAKGGMETKIRAAKMAIAGRTSVIIANGHKADTLAKILEGQEVGTFFIPKEKKEASARKLVILSQPSRGTIIIDKGAGKAIREEGRSLLAAGVISADGNFESGDAVKIKIEGETQPRSLKGIINYNSNQVSVIAGKTYKEIKKLLNIDSVDEVVHRDQMVEMKKKLKSTRKK